ncbi:hypothetical protein M0P65_03240 [Candidatus Gracilibacteria bacterium]|nr:hypothetical protein [Candidatus Gracilibacteria bacterium]
MEQITELGKTRTKNITDLIIAQAMAEQVEYRPDILRKKYPDDIKGALGIKAPKGDIFSHADQYRILNMFPLRHDILQNVKVLVFRKRDLVNEIISGDIDIRDVSILEDKIRQRVLALFLKKEISKTKHGSDPFLVRCANKYKHALKKIEFLRNVRTLSLDVSDIIGMSGYKGKNRFKILNKYNQLLEKNGQGHRKLVIETTPEEKKKIVKRLKILRSGKVDDTSKKEEITPQKLQNSDKKILNSNYFNAVSKIIMEIKERNILKSKTSERECENFLKFCEVISRTTGFYYQGDINRANRVLDCLIREFQFNINF